MWPFNRVWPLNGGPLNGGSTVLRKTNKIQNKRQTYHNVTQHIGDPARQLRRT